MNQLFLLKKFYIITTITILYQIIAMNSFYYKFKFMHLLLLNMAFIHGIFIKKMELYFIIIDSFLYFNVYLILNNLLITH